MSNETNENNNKLPSLKANDPELLALLQKFGEDPFVSLRELRDTWSNEIPEEIVTSTSPPEKKTVKVRAIWFTLVTGLIGLIDIEGQLPEENKELILEYLDFSSSGNLSASKIKRTTSLDILVTDKIISLVLGEKEFKRKVNGQEEIVQVIPEEIKQEIQQLKRQSQP